MPAKGDYSEGTNSLYSEGTSSAYSHIYNKGVEDRIIFNDEADYQVFLSFLEGYLTPPADPETTKKAFTVNGRVFRGIPHQPKNYFNKVKLIAYCLMPSHFHLALHQATPGSVENFIRSLCTRYSIYFNKKYQRTGTLFGGRYKFSWIKDAPSLRLLTRYFHQAGDSSSYPEYLGKRITPWVDTNVVLSLQKHSRSSYQDFVEKYQLNQKEKDLLEKIVFESEPEHFDRDTLTVASDLQPRLKLPEFIAIASVFILLVTVGIRNVRDSAAKTVLGTTASATPAVLSTDSDAKEAQPQQPQPPALVTVKLDDASTSANIRQDPTVESAKIGQAHNGDTFEFVSENSGWYEIQLPDNSTGFVSDKYAVKEGANN